MTKQLPDLSKMKPESPENEPEQLAPESETAESLTHSSEATSSSYGEPEWEAMEGQAEPETEADPSRPAILSKEEFFGMFRMAFAAPNMIPVGPFPIQSLPISDEEAEAARAASDVIYEIAEDTPALRWMIEPGNVWIQRAMIIGQFAAIKVAVVSMELRARRAKPVEPSKPQGGAKPTSGPEKFAEPV